MKFLDLFAGIGGFRLGMESAGHECVGFCEIDKFARTSYKAIHNTEGEVEMHDITTVSDEFIRGIGSVDVICGGFPCQAFSIAGKRKGFEDTRGTLFFEIARFASILRPRYLFLENVKGLLNHEGGATFETIIRALDELGYDVEWQVLNSKDYVPQNRERVFIIGHLRGERTRKIFPFSGNDEQINPKYRIKKIGNIRKKGLSQSGDVVSIEGIAPTMCSTTTQKDPTKIVVPVLTPDRIEKRQNGRRFKEDGDEMFTLTAQDRHGIMVAGKLPGNHDQNSRVYNPNGIAPTLSTMQGGGQEPKIIQKPRGYNEGGIHEIAPTLSSNSWHENNILENGFQIRKLTPRECWRLQGFPDWAFDRAKQVNSDSQLYKQAGNSVTVPVIADIAKRL
ncbi:DNA (cytosine-5-)-methyltransferase [Enterococcus durans]|uniref:Cytosine-specific methyltransferase n=1 Tax=Enterococcus durans TaxID=53345 RepID=A0A5N0YJL0_9ENTE|nr:DNA (cytosine-5-)-methyltransferase [Enterococcus durans]KAA9175237.1 DNA (cytosine-5-)-methyltransferase [Enterococcus durans]KAA9189717.1 DNA (cytosine-5-)-methyltransferase [Enterococcus durans]KAA9202442.1 DNA (cytosine-5-)-methyltransferase [Enterococcus durans]